MRFDKTANGCAWLQFEFMESSDLWRVAIVLEKEFSAQERRRFSDPLGDAVWIEYEIEGQPLTLDWDHWVGVGVISEQKQGDTTLKRIADYFETHPLPPMPPREPTPWWTRILKWGRAPAD